MQSRIVPVAAAFLLLAVILGAFGAHGLRDSISEQALSNWQTGVSYQFYHALGLLALAALQNAVDSPWLIRIRNLFTAGILLFSGSLYLLATRDLSGIQGVESVLGPLTPIGGLCFILGWAILLWRSLVNRGSRLGTQD